MALPPAPYPATVEVTRPVDDRASVAFRGNRYSVNPGMGGIELVVRHRLGTATVEIVTPAGMLLVGQLSLSWVMTRRPMGGWGRCRLGRA